MSGDSAHLENRIDINSLTFPEVSLPLYIRKELFAQLYLFWEVDITKFSTDFNVDEISIKRYIQLLIQSLILRGYYRGNSFVVNAFYKYPLIHTKGLSADQIALLGVLCSAPNTTLALLSNIFSESKHDVIIKLKMLILNGLLICKVQRDNVRVQWLYSPEKKTNVSKEDKILVGTCMMLKKAELTRVSKLLSISRKEVVIRLSKLIFYGHLEAEFSQRTKFFGGAKIFIYVKRFLIKPRELNIDALDKIERDAVGFLMLCKQTTIRELSKLMNVSEIDAIKTLALLTAEGTFQCVFVGKNKVLPVIIPELKPRQTIEELAALSFFNYEALMGILSVHSSISLRQLANALNRDVGEILDALEKLVLEGFLEATLVGTTLHIEKIYRYSRTHEGTLERWEKIVLGMIIAKPYITVNDLSKAFKINKFAAKERLYSFYGKGLIKGKLEKNALIPEEVPIFPPLTQLDDLPLHYQEIFGYLISRRNVKIKNLQTIWQKTEIAIKNAVYEMTGSGLLIVEEQKKRFYVTSYQPFFPQKEIRELGQAYIKVINNIEKRRNQRKIKLNELALATDLPKIHVFKIICQLIAHGYYNGVLSTKSFIVLSELVLPPRKKNCIYCGHPLDQPDKPCPNCNKLAPKCIICHGFLKSGDEVSECPNCNNLAHKDHMIQWLSIKKECPICKTILTDSSLRHKKL